MRTMWKCLAQCVTTEDSISEPKQVGQEFGVSDWKILDVNCEKKKKRKVSSLMHAFLCFSMAYYLL